MDTTPRASELMPHVLELIKKHRQLRKGEIEEAIKKRVAQMGYSYRAPALGYALTYLKRSGYAANPRHGFWCVTLEGQAVHLDEAAARDIERHIEAEYPRKSNNREPYV